MSSQNKKISARVRIARNLQELRINRGMTQEFLSGAAEITQTYLSQIENGKRNISLDTLEKLSDVLGVDISDVLKVDISDLLHI